jgi:hypothetical protein
MTYGRPLMMPPQLTRHTLHLPAPIDDEYLTRYPKPPGKQPEGVPSLMACYSQTLVLQEILGEILASFYQGDHTASSSQSGPKYHAEVSNSSLVSRLKAGDFQDLFRLEGMLSSWYDGLPPYLKVYQGVSNVNSVPQESTNLVPPSIIFARQANTLRTR